MRFTAAIDLFVTDRTSQGRINSPATERDYRATLLVHAEDVDNRDPRKTGRDDVKATLRRWPHPNSQRKHRPVLVAFYDWMGEEGLRDTNPARQTPRPEEAQADGLSLTRGRGEGNASRMPDRARAVGGPPRTAYPGSKGGTARVPRRHFRRPDLVHIPAGIAKGNRERWILVLRSLRQLSARSSAWRTMIS